jgi:FkbM family methyltransferase
MDSAKENKRMLRRLARIIQYNRDWPLFLWSKLLPPRGDELLTFRLRTGHTLTIAAEVQFLLNEIFVDRVYDLPGVQLGSSPAILDVGANFGLFAHYAAAKSGGAKIFCFEPSSRNFAILEQNVRRNGIQARAFRLAVAPTSGEATLSLATSSAEYALAEAHDAGEVKTDAAQAPSERVECVDLERVFELTGVECFDLVKMDIEGIEREILTQCPDHLLLRMRALVIEWHHSWEELEALAARFRKLGFLAEPTLLQGHIRYLRAWQPRPASELAREPAPRLLAAAPN